MSLAILVAVVSVFVMSSFLCECRVRWLKHACIHLPQGDEMNHTPYSAKFLPGTMLRCGAEVIRGNITYRVVGMVVITINDERWLLYRLQCPKIKRRVALGGKRSQWRIAHSLVVGRWELLFFALYGEVICICH